MNKGFTLVEVIGVIVILGVVSIFAVPSITKSIEVKKQQNYDNLIKDLENAAKTYFQITENTNSKVSVEKLKNEGFISKNLIDPFTKEAMNGCMYKILDDGYYIYTYRSSCEGD